VHSTKVEFGFENSRTKSRAPADQNPHLSDWTQANSNSRASTTDAHTEAERSERVAASRRGAVLFLGCFLLALTLWQVGRALWFAL
jgi:hypothetical protein